jgi:tetratricopeptide (TPR) repeat protein
VPAFVAIHVNFHVVEPCGDLARMGVIPAAFAAVSDLQYEGRLLSPASLAQAGEPADPQAQHVYEIFKQNLPQMSASGELVELLGYPNYAFLQNAAGLLIGASSSDADDSLARREMCAQAVTDFLLDAGSNNVSTGQEDLSSLDAQALESLARAGVAEAVKDVGLRSFNAGDRHAAAQAWRQASEMWHGGTMRNLGIDAEEAGDFYTALEWFERAKKVGFTQASARVVIATFLSGNEARAIEMISEVGAQSAGAAATKIGSHLREKGDNEGAIKWWIRGIETGYLRPVIALSPLLREMGRIDEAREWYEWAGLRGDILAYSMARLMQAELNS